MDREKLNKDGLFEQYLLGLTTREETVMVEECLRKDPQARADLDFLRQQLGVYLDDRGMEEKTDAPSTDGFANDEEVLAYLLDRNQRLNIIRYILLAISVLLVGSTMYFYRQSQRYSNALLTERSHHVQDKNLHQATLEKLNHEIVHLDSLRTFVTGSPAGDLQFHYLPSSSLTLLDISHLAPLEDGYAYHIHLIEDTIDATLYVVKPEAISKLYSLGKTQAHLGLYYGPATSTGEKEDDSLKLIAELDLAKLYPEK